MSPRATCPPKTQTLEQCIFLPIDEVTSVYKTFFTIDIYSVRRHTYTKLYIHKYVGCSHYSTSSSKKYTLHKRTFKKKNLKTALVTIIMLCESCCDFERPPGTLSPKVALNTINCCIIQCQIFVHSHSKAFPSDVQNV